jgi:hypothetical protein
VIVRSPRGGRQRSWSAASWWRSCWCSASSLVRDQRRRQRPPLLGREELARLSSYQRAIVYDGEITQNEYRAAIEATIACARAEGTEIDGPEAEPDGTLGYSIGLNAGGGPAARTAPSRCAHEYSDVVSVLWATRSR